MRIISILKRGIKYILYGVPTVKQIRANVVALDINKMLEGKVAVVTGASGGIGKAIALAYGKAGASVAVHYHGNKSKAEAVKNEIEAAGGKAVVTE